MEEMTIAQEASIKAFSQLNIARLELKRLENSTDDYADFGTTRERVIEYHAKQARIWEYITLLIEQSI